MDRKTTGKAKKPKNLSIFLSKAKTYFTPNDCSTNLALYFERKHIYIDYLINDLWGGKLWCHLMDQLSLLFLFLFLFNFLDSHTNCLYSS